MSVAGYAHPAYAAALAEFGEPLALPRCRGWLLRRAIPGTPFRDAMGCYPLFACQDWSGLADDIAEHAATLVSFCAVLDPFGDYAQDDLQRAFPDELLAYKTHFVVDTERPLEGRVPQNHRRNARKALDAVQVELVADPLAVLDDWVALYRVLCSRHAITGLRAFSRASFARQLAVPGITVFRGLLNGETIGMLLWYVQRQTAYYHLGAQSVLGYERHVSFGLLWRAIEHFRNSGFRWLNLGAGAGASEPSSGLTRFKEGWATESRTAYFGARILDRDRYQQLASHARAEAGCTYFPVYRAGEFA